MTDPVTPLRKILFAPAAGPNVGGGHVVRCLTLANALQDRGAAVSFVVNKAGADLIERFGGGAVSVHLATADVVLEQDAFDVLVIDDYTSSSATERQVRDRVSGLVVIDDLADRPHLADLLIDPGYGRVGSDYEGLLAPHARLLMGPDYALVRPAFAALRPITLARPLANTPHRLFVSFGLSDVDGVAARAVAAIRNRFETIHIDVALSSTAQSAGALKARAKTDLALHLHVDTSDIAPLMASADVAVGAGGASTWERCCLGLPTLAVIVADNQRPTIRRLKDAGALLALDLTDEPFEAALTNALIGLWDQAVRETLKARSAALCDGLGAARIADAILAL